MRRLLREVGEDDDMPTLSKREKTVLELIAEGLSSPEIAERLHLSGRTSGIARR